MSSKTTCRRIAFAFMLLACTMFASLPSAAQGLDNIDKLEKYDVFSANRTAHEEKKLSDPYYIAMLFYRVAGISPDFKYMVTHSYEYLNASDNEKAYMVEDKIEEFQNLYNLITLREPISVEVPITLSKYSEKLKGFFIKDFSEDYFIPLETLGKNFALIPAGIIDQQWVKVDDDKVAEIIRKENALGILQRRPLTMVLSLSPKYADVKNPVDIGGKEFYPMSVKIDSMELYSTNYEEPLWNSKTDSGYDDDKLKELLKIR